MLKLTLKPGEYIDIGESIRNILSGGSANNIHLLIDAPREISVLRSSARVQKGLAHRYYKESGISKEAQREIADIIMREKRNSGKLESDKKKPSEKK